jgi:hypothetical protein
MSLVPAGRLCPMRTSLNDGVVFPLISASARCFSPLDEVAAWAV